MVQALVRISTNASVYRTIIFAVGHFFIDFFTIVMVTGSTLEAAAQASVIAPILNSGWYYTLDRLWTTAYSKKDA